MACGGWGGPGVSGIATVGQTHMRGLGTPRPWFGRTGGRCLTSFVSEQTRSKSQDSCFQCRLLCRPHARFPTPAAVDASAAALLLSPSSERRRAPPRTTALVSRRRGTGRLQGRRRDGLDQARRAPRLTVGSVPGGVVLNR
jgi:hypothetical protein